LTWKDMHGKQGKVSVGRAPVFQRLTFFGHYSRRVESPEEKMVGTARPRY
jgi:hypothetical protein